MLKTFSKGGIHPPENKLSAKKEIEKLAVPQTVAIPISQHLGVPAKPIVERRENVQIGQLIAKSEGFVSANIHATVSGMVTKIDMVIDSSGYKRQAIIIKNDGEETWVDGVDLSGELIKEIKDSPEIILKKILNNGIVGLGGATFPSHVKLSVPKGKKADVLIINGVECEPYLTSDHQLMIEKTEEILVGIQILMKAINVNRAIIGIENNKEDAINKMSEFAKVYSGITVEPLKVQYPQGGEKQLIKALINREVPSAGLPIDCGAVVHNVGTAFAVYEAVQKNKPLIERVVTITGKSVDKPSNFLTRIGTPVSQLIDAAGGLPEDTGKVISGGPMMGKAINNLEAPVTKGTSGVLIMPNTESRREKIQNCIRCARCVDVCPMGLEPHLLLTLSKNQADDRLEKERVMDCIECGSCSYVCPAARPLLDYIRLGKFEVSKNLRSRAK